MKTSVVAAIGALLASTPALAQEMVMWGAPPLSSGQMSYFPMGTELQLTTRIELNTKNNHAGDRFYLEVAEPLIYRGQVVVPVGSTAVGEVMRSERNGHFGKKGQLDIRLLYVQTPHGPVRLTGRTRRDGNGQGALAIAGGALLAWPMIFIHGTSGKIPADTSVTGYLADDLRFAVQQQSVQSAAVVPDDINGRPRALPARFDAAAFSRRP
ncbi:MAG: hypothetical protein EOO81_12415 [Oxalobacteraceae bacterium]|nr:MAG: hypothetical protein EOO81_12415 [Oxalobacteraceae bacterium]